MVSTITSDARPRATHRCTCHSIRENSSGVSYSLFMLGVLCGFCEGNIADAEEACRRESLTEAERIREDVEARWSQARRRVHHLARRAGAPEALDPPF